MYDAQVWERAALGMHIFISLIMCELLKEYAESFFFFSINTSLSVDCCTAACASEPGVLAAAGNLSRREAFEENDFQKEQSKSPKIGENQCVSYFFSSFHRFTDRW